MRVAALQMASTFGRVEENRARLVHLLGGLPAEVGLAVAPELAITGYDLEGIAEIGEELAEPVDGPTGEALSRIAAEREMVVVVGFLEQGEDGRRFDSALVADADGSLAAYRKTHLYPNEQPRFDAGDVLEPLPTTLGPLGVMICFEHAFPEITTTLALRGASMLAIPSAVPDGYEYLIELRTRARAQDSQLFAVAANMCQGGFCGQSVIVAPDGRVLTQAAREETVLLAEFDAAATEKERDREPALRMRRPDLYA